MCILHKIIYTLAFSLWSSHWQGKGDQDSWLTLYKQWIDFSKGKRRVQNRAVSYNTTTTILLLFRGKGGLGQFVEQNQCHNPWTFHLSASDWEAGVWNTALIDGWEVTISSPLILIYPGLVLDVLSDQMLCCTLVPITLATKPGPLTSATLRNSDTRVILVRNRL